MNMATALKDVSLLHMRHEGARCQQCDSCQLRSSCLKLPQVHGELEILRNLVSHHRKLPQRSLLSFPDQVRKYVYVIRKGAIKCFEQSEEGQERVVGFALPGETIGLNDLNSERFSSFAIAVADTELCEISLASLREFVNGQIIVCRELLRATTQEYQQQTHSLCERLRLSSMGRVARFLLSMDERLNHGRSESDHITLPMSRSDIASYLCMKTETVSRSISKLQMIGALKVCGKRIQFLDRAKLLNSCM